MAATDPIRTKQNVRKMADFYLQRGQLRNHALLLMGVYTALRISDLLRLTWDDVYDFQNARFRQHVYLVEKKTGKPKTVALNKAAVQALRLLAATGKRQSGRFLFESNRRSRAAISRVQAYRIIRAAAEGTHVSGHISCHSLRKTFGYHAWKSGTPAVVIMDIYNHSSFNVTRRYLGICQDDRDEAYLALSFA